MDRGGHQSGHAAGVTRHGPGFALENIECLFTFDPMKIWHYLDKAEQPRQTPESELVSMVEANEISRDSLVWNEDLTNWTPAHNVLPELFNTGSSNRVAPPPVPSSITAQRGEKTCDEVDYEIIGDDMQVLEVELDPSETVVAEAGAMNYLEDNISFEAKMGDGSGTDSGIMGKLLAVGKRAISGESIFMTHFTNNGSDKRRVAFAAPYPGKIIPLDMSEIGGEFICQKDAFLCAAKGTELSIAFNKRLGAGFFGGEGFILQRLRGDGMAFVHAGGTVVRRELKGETLRVDTGCLVGFTPGINYDIQRAGNLKSMFFGGEGLFLATVQGTGTVFLQSLPFSRMADRILANAPSSGGKSTGEGSLLGGIGRFMDGDNR